MAWSMSTRRHLHPTVVMGLYRGFGPSVVGIIVYRGLYFGMYDSLKPVVLIGALEDNFLASFLLGWTVTTGAGIASYPLDTIRRRMMMTSGEVSLPFQCNSNLTIVRPSNTRVPSMLVVKLSLPRVSDHYSRVQVPTFSVVLPVPVCSPSTTRCSFSSSARSSRADLVKRHHQSKDSDASHVLNRGRGCRLKGQHCRGTKGVRRPLRNAFCVGGLDVVVFYESSIVCSISWRSGLVQSIIPR